MFVLPRASDITSFLVICHMKFLRNLVLLNVPACMCIRQRFSDIPHQVNIVFIFSLNIAYKVCTFISRKNALSRCRTVTESTRYSESSNTFEISEIRCYLNSLLRHVTDNSSQVYYGRYIGFRVGASKYFLTGTTLHIETCTNFRRNWFTGQNSKREHFRYLFCTVDFSSLSTSLLNRTHCRKVDSQ